MNAFSVLFLSLFHATSATETATASTPAPSSASAPAVVTPVAPPPFRLMSAQRDAKLRGLLPQVADAHVQSILEDPRTLLYTEAEMPRAYQFWGGAVPGVHAPEYNISGGQGEPFGNGNREFPWGRPAGTDRASQVRSFRFLWLPNDAAGRTLPVVWFRRASRDDGGMGYGWTFPVGSVLGEVLLMAQPGQPDVVFEIRIRQRERSAWDVNAFRPFPTCEDLAARIKSLRADWPDRPALAQLVSHLESSRALPVEQLRDRQPRTVFSESMGIDALPAVDDPALVRELLTTTAFQPCVGISWRLDPQGNSTAAPTTTAAFHVVPAHYAAGFVEVNRQSCNRCHETTNRNVRSFDAGREWYGRIRGSDGIFSFHPFSAGSISHNGSSEPTTIRGELVHAGVVAAYQPSLHTQEHYAAIPGLE